MYIPISPEDKIGIYDSQHTVIAVSQVAVLVGWKVPGKGMWRIFLVNNMVHEDEDTIITKKSPIEILRENPPHQSTTC